MTAIAFLLFAVLVLAWLVAPGHKTATPVPAGAPSRRTSEAAA